MTTESWKFLSFLKFGNGGATFQHRNAMGYPRLKSCQRWRDRTGETRWKRYETIMTWPASIHKCFTTAILLSSVRVFRVHDTAWSFSTRPLTFGISLFLRFSFKWRHNERVLKLLVRSIDIIIIIMLQNRKY